MSRHELRSTRTIKHAIAKILPALLAVVMVSTTLLQGVGSAAASTSPGLHKGMQFYRGKTLLIIAPSPPGGSFDEWARTVAPAVGVFLHATVQVENISGAGTILGEDRMVASAADGLTIGEINPTNDATAILTGNPGVNFNPARLPLIAGAKRPPNCIDTSASSPYANFGDVVHSTTPVAELSSVNGSDYDGIKLLNEAFNINHTLLSAYASPTSELQGFERGDGVMIDQAPSLVGSYIVAGKARCIIALHPAAAGGEFAKVEIGVPTLAQVAKMYPPKTRAAKDALAALEALYSGTNVIFAAPPGTPTDRLDALRAAFQFSMTNKATEKQALSLANSPGWLSGPVCKATYQNLFKVLKPVITYLKG